MKFSLTWLKDHLDTDADAKAVEATMTMAGLEVEHIEDAGETLAAFTMAYVKAAEPHPDADRLRVCTVDTADGEKTIVCGAPNARAGMWAVYAPLGTYIPGADFSLDPKPRKIRGVESHGMLCSADELDVGGESDGILDLEGDFTVGQPAASALGIDDPVIDFEVTPNRPDWLGVRGIARDLAAAGLGTLRDKTDVTVEGQMPCPIGLEVEENSGCTFFAGRLVEGVTNGPSPEWLQQRLRAVGINPKNALVDITNYLSLDRARPLHVYDADKLTGTVRARAGREGETLDALDGGTYALAPHHCVIADDVRALGIGGVMGGTHSGCTEATTRVFIEAALFDALQTLRTGRELAIQSDAQYRFARGVDPAFCVPGLELATQLILECCGGTPSQIVSAGTLPAVPGPVVFPLSEVRRLTDLDVSPDTMRAQLTDLGCKVTPADEATWQVTPPSWRGDITHKSDLVEEIARLTGFDRLEALSLRRPAGRPAPGISPPRARRGQVRRALAHRGLHETVTFSFCSAHDFERFGGTDAALALRNPISSALTYMRPSALPHLVDAVGRNADRALRNIALFEVGPVYRGITPDDQSVVAAGVRLAETPRDWRGGGGVDAYTAKADALAALQVSGAPVDNLQVADTEGAHWHPGRSGRLQLGPKLILAEFGELHPDITGDERRMVAFEVYLDRVPLKPAKTTAKPALDASDLMALHRDFAFVVEEDVAADTLLRAVRGADKALIGDVRLFDIYRGKGLGEGEKSLALEVTLQPRDKTLDEAAIKQVSDAIVAAAQKSVGARLR